MTGIIIGAIVVIAIIFFVNQSNEEKRKTEEENKRLRLIRLQKEDEKKKIDEANRIEKIRLQKIEDAKYETFKIVVVGRRDEKFTCVLQRENKTFAYVERPETVFQLNSTMKLLKDKANDFKWISETAHNKKQGQLKEQKEREEKLESQKALQLILKKQSDFHEINTTYCTDLQTMFLPNPRNFGFTTIRSLSKNCGVWNELDNGVRQLNTYEQLSQYIFSYGNMHQAKLNQAFQSLLSQNHFNLTGQQIEIIDYGCGQGIGSIVLIDYLKSKTNFNCSISKVKLIEPSELALKRAALNIRYSLKSANQIENVFSIHKELNDINDTDIATSTTSTKIHIFSNILDVDDFSINNLSTLISNSQKGENYFICVSPKFWEDGNHPRNLRLNSFVNNFERNYNCVQISQREDDIQNPSNPEKPYRRHERLFKVNFSSIQSKNNLNWQNKNNVSIGDFDDDLPF